MKRMRYILTTALLLVLTVAVSFGPSIASAYNNEKRIGRVEITDVLLPKRAPFTAHDLVRAYADGKIIRVSNVVEEESERPEEEDMKTEVRSVLKNFLKTDKALCETVLEAVDIPIKYYQRNDILFLWKEEPTALSFITVGIHSDRFMLDLCYEAKTGVVISATYINTSDQFEDGVRDELLSDFSSATAHYFEIEYGLSPEEHYFVPSLSQFELYIAVGIKQKSSREEDKEIQF